MGALGCTQRTRGSRRVGSALEWLGDATCTVEETCACGWRCDVHRGGDIYARVAVREHAGVSAWGQRAGGGSAKLACLVWRRR